MNKLYVFVIFIIIVIGGILGFMIYNYNESFREEQLQHQQEISRIKQEQERLTKEFEEEQKHKTAKIQQEHIAQMLKDEDGDGLTRTHHKHCVIFS